MQDQPNILVVRYSNYPGMELKDVGYNTVVAKDSLKHKAIKNDMDISSYEGKKAKVMVIDDDDSDVVDACLGIISEKNVWI